jgi:DNA modification methylase
MTQVRRDKQTTREGPGDIVLDPFLGSGSILITAERTGRICRGVEIDPLYVDIAIRRWRRISSRHGPRARPLEETGARHGR